MKTIAATALLALLALSQAASAQPAFDVASVKVNNDPGRQLGLGPIQYSPDTLTMRGVSLWMVLRWAYGVENFRLSAPDWMQRPPFYDIVAKSAGPVSRNDLRLMLRRLLAERFHLMVHDEKKETAATALLVVKGGPKFHESTGIFDPELGGEAPLYFLGTDNYAHIQRRLYPDGHAQFSFTDLPMSVFAGFLEGTASVTAYGPVPVVDMTELQGRFDFKVVLEPSLRQEGDGPESPDEVMDRWKRILPNQLGLTLESRKATVDVLVVEHADKEPTPN